MKYNLLVNMCQLTPGDTKIFHPLYKYCKVCIVMRLSPPILLWLLGQYGVRGLHLSIYTPIIFQYSTSILVRLDILVLPHIRISAMYLHLLFFKSCISRILDNFWLRMKTISTEIRIVASLLQEPTRECEEPISI